MPEAVRIKTHACAVCQKSVPCTATDNHSSHDGSEACAECESLQIQTEDAATGKVSAVFFCCNEHMYDFLLQSEHLFGDEDEEVD